MYDRSDWFAADDFFGSDPSLWAVTAQLRTTSDDPDDAAASWSDWEDLVVGDYTARAFECRLLLEPASADMSLIVTSAAFTADVPDRSISFEDVETGVGAIPLVFEPPFYALKDLQVTGQNMQTGDYWTVTGKNATGATVQYFDGNGNAVSRSFDAHAFGYGSLQRHDRTVSAFNATRPRDPYLQLPGRGRQMTAWDALLTMHGGDAAPSYVQAGTVWLDTSSTPSVKNFYDDNTNIQLEYDHSTTHQVQRCFFKGTNIASAAVLTLPGDGNVIEVASTATKRIGNLVTLRFAGQLTLTHSVNLRLPDAADISTWAGDYGLFHEYDESKRECVSFNHNTTRPIPAAVQTELDRIDTELTDKVDDDTEVLAGTGPTGAGALDADVTLSADVATQAEAEAGASTSKAMTPQRTVRAIAEFSPAWKKSIVGRILPMHRRCHLMILAIIQNWSRCYCHSTSSYMSVSSYSTTTEENTDRFKRNSSEAQTLFGVA